MNNSKLIWILFGLTLVMMIVIRLQNEALITVSAPLGILSLEFTGSADQVEFIRSEWVGSIRNSFYINTVLDYIYLIVYGLFLFLASHYLTWLRPGTARIGSMAAMAGLTAAGLDAVENALMFVSIVVGAYSPIAIATVVFAGVKFLLAAFSVFYILVSAFTLLLDGRRRLWD